MRVFSEHRKAHFSSPSFFLLILLLIFSACQEIKHPDKSSAGANTVDYNELVKELAIDSLPEQSDSANLFDKPGFDPTDSLALFDSIQSGYQRDSLMVRRLAIRDSGILNQLPDTALSNPRDSFSNQIKKINTDELKALKYNLDQLRRTDTTRTALCKQLQCRVWARISKKDQRLRLYLDGQLVDTFKVSTGDRKHETPLFDRRPSGPSFQKYTSKKFPGGNYNGLGNMPYVVFISGGYGIHGTTRGNISKLGKKASHGCIRLHPDQAKIFFELVRKVGIENTWITVLED